MTKISILRKVIGYSAMLMAILIFAVGYLAAIKFYLNEANVGYFIVVSIVYFLICLLIGAVTLSEDKKEEQEQK